MSGIFETPEVLIDLKDIDHIEKLTRGIFVIPKNTKWDVAHDIWANALYLGGEEAVKLISAWKKYKGCNDEN